MSKLLRCKICKVGFDESILVQHARLCHPDDIDELIMHYLTERRDSS